MKIIIKIIAVQTLVIAAVATVSYCIGSFYGTPILVDGTTLPASPVAGTFQTNNIQGVPIK